ncbi:phage tail tape measure protein [Oscillibacter sp.]|uniref:phage tail tape measure protein n=1 Tax=Oscillibacter sp. TaxID=1945593 RepID=UPI00289D4916|nr:phage tail tape measure protein [Oscillibacter sp.]
MATKIRGISIEISGDTTGLTQSLKGVNGQIAGTQKQLRDVERLLKLDPTNTELLAQKQKLLSQAVNQTSEKLEQVKQMEALANKEFAAGKIGEEQYDAIKREVAATTSNLESLEKRASESNATLGKVAGELDNVSDKAEAAATATKGISVAAGAAAIAIGSMAVKAGLAADDLNTLSNQSGFSTETIQEWQYAADRIDVSVDSIIGAARKMKKNMDSTSTDVQSAWLQLGVSVKDGNGNFRDAEAVFNDVTMALSRIPNETERDMLAMQIFGKSADELAGIIDDGGAALRQMGEEAKNSGLILSQDALDGANAFNDGIDELKAKASAAFMEAGAAAAENLLPALEELGEWLSKAIQWIASLDGNTLAMAFKIAIIVAAVSPLAKMISNVTDAVGGVINIAPKLMGVLTPANLKLALIVASVAALAFLAAKLAGAWDDMSGMEKVISVLGLVTAAALTAAVALGAFQSAATMGVAAIGIVAGVTAVLASISMAEKRAKQMSSSTTVPAFANGGSLTSGSAVVGEAGAELLSVNNGRATVRPLSGPAADAVNNRSGGGAQNVTIEFTGSLAQLGRVLQPVIKAEGNRVGPSLVR